MNIQMLSEAEMLSRFGDSYLGYCIPKVEGNTAGVWILKDLTGSLLIFVTTHELYHYNDADFNNESVLVREIRANIAGFKAAPLALFTGAWYWLTHGARWLTYLKRILGGY